MKRLIDQLHKCGVEEIVISGGEPFIRNDMAEILRFAKEECHIERMSVISNGTMEWNRLISIDAKGDVYPCHMLHKNELKLGNALEDELMDIVFSPDNIFLKLDVDAFDGCNECEYKYLCGGGCRGRSYLRHLKLNQKDAYCAMIYDYYKDLIKNIKRSIGVM